MRVSPRLFSYLHGGRSVREILIDYLSTRETAAVDDIVRDCHLSRRTVRAFLKMFEEKGLVRRVYDYTKPYDVVVLPALRELSLNTSST